MNPKEKIKKSMMLILMLLFVNVLTAQDSITFSLQSSHGVYYIPVDLVIRATNGEQFTIDWGDDTSIETKTGLGTADIDLSHRYEDYPVIREYTVTIAAFNADCKFTYFDCHTYVTDDVWSFQINSLKLSECSNLEYLNCSRNCLQLSDLYAAHLIIKEQGGKLFGTQFLPYQPLTGGMTVDFSAQRIFGGVETAFAVWKGMNPAIFNVDYSIDNGIITFISDGTYTVTMTNGAIISHPNYPAEVRAGYNLTINILENSLSKAKVFPNPTNNIVCIEMESGVTPEVKVYSLHGRLLQQIRNTEIDLSNYSAGVYILSIDGKTVKIIKQ